MYNFYLFILKNKESTSHPKYNNVCDAPNVIVMSHFVKLANLGSPFYFIFLKINKVTLE